MSLPFESDIKDEQMTFTKVGDIAWEIGGESVTRWAQEFNGFTLEHAPQITKALDDYAILYGVPKPTSPIVIDLHHNPLEGNTNGGPRSNYAEMESRFPIVRKMGDFMYRLPLFGSRNAPSVLEQTVKILHEVQHSSFQGADFENTVKSSVDLPEVQAKLKRISGEGGVIFRKYANEPLELVTTYLENIVDLQKPQYGDTDFIPFEFRAQKELQSAIIEIEATQDKENPNGASAKFVSAWKKALEDHLEHESAITSPISTVRATTQERLDGPKPAKYFDVYQLGRALDPTLAYEYLALGKKIDSAFIERLVDMAEAKVFEI